MIIYKRINTINHKVYVGQTSKSEQDRWKVHVYESFDDSNKREYNFYFHRAIRKYGPKNFEGEVLEECSSREQLNDREQYWISHYKSNDPKFGYNMTAGGGGIEGFKHRKETIKKMSKAAKGKKFTKEHCKNISMSHIGLPGNNLGRKFSEEHRKNISSSKSGPNHPFFGKKRPDLSKRFSGVNNPYYGKKHSEETKAKMRAAKLKHKLTNSPITK